MIVEKHFGLKLICRHVRKVLFLVIVDFLELAWNIQEIFLIPCKVFEILSKLLFNLYTPRRACWEAKCLLKCIWWLNARKIRFEIFGLLCWFPRNLCGSYCIFRDLGSTFRNFWGILKSFLKFNTSYQRLNACKLIVLRISSPNAFKICLSLRYKTMDFCYWGTLSFYDN